MKADYPDTIIVCNVELKRGRPPEIKAAYWSGRIRNLLIAVTYSEANRSYWCTLDSWFVYQSSLNEVIQKLEERIKLYIEAEIKSERNFETAMRYFGLVRPW